LTVHVQFEAVDEGVRVRRFDGRITRLRVRGYLRLAAWKELGIRVHFVPRKRELRHRRKGAALVRRYCPAPLPEVGRRLIKRNLNRRQQTDRRAVVDRPRFEIDDRPYRYLLEKAISDQATLEGQISDERRKIAALVSAVSVSQAYIHSTEADVSR